eukprot:GFUD01010505.1.p1 GENE.GFUD01010505.1~~GFUD01010505.1.p1  ORF type:complete len:160 (+),score=31.90 GFUD01010505.1:288-767(+)
MAFVSELVDSADLCQLDTKSFTRDDAISVAALSGMKDRLLAEKTLAENYTPHAADTHQRRLHQGDQKGHGRGHGTTTLKRVPKMEDMSDEELDRKISAPSVMRLKKSGQYSVRFNSKDKEVKHDKVARCIKYEEGRCPARGKDCFTCEVAGGGLCWCNF